MKGNHLLLLFAAMFLGGACECLTIARAEGADGKGLDKWDACYEGSAPPRECGWGVSAGKNTKEQIENGCLRIIDRGTERTQLHAVSRAWAAEPEFGGIVEARVRVISCTKPAGCCILAADGVHEAALTLYPDRIELHRLGLSYPMDTTDGFHVYRIEIRGKDVRVWVDGKLRINGKGKLTREAYHGRRCVTFGSISSPATSEALWDYVRFRSLAPRKRRNVKAEDIIIYKKEGIYACFPGVYKTAEGAIFVSFGTRVRRSHIDSTGGTAMRISYDGGRTWQPIKKRPQDPAWVCPDGTLLSAGAIGWKYVSEKEAAKLRARGVHVRRVREGVFAYALGAFARRSTDGGATWKTIRIKTPPMYLLMGFTNAAHVKTSKGTHLVAVYGIPKEGDKSHAYVLRTDDNGKTWTFSLLAAPVGEFGFNETALCETPDGKILAMMRSQPEGYLWSCFSTDQGKTWSKPKKTKIWGYPAHLLVLKSGAILCSYGYRRMPMGVRACLSHNNGKTWDIEHEFVLRDDGQGSPSDLGYPTSVELDDGTIVTIYYMTTKDGITHVAATRWTIPSIQNQNKDPAK